METASTAAGTPVVVSGSTPTTFITTTSTAPAVKESVQQPTSVPDDLLSRVTKFQMENDPAKKPEPDIDFDFKDIEKLPPEAKTYAEKAYKSMQKGFNNKFQELADLRKKLEVAQPGWTPERLQSELNNPEFVAAAKAIMTSNQVQNPPNSGLTEDEYSMLNPAEKQKLAEVPELKRKIEELENKSLQALIQARNQEEDTRLQARYSNYNPQAIDTITADMLSGKVTATREHLYKAMYHDENVKRAYAMGLEDSKKGITEKINSVSVDGITTVSASETPTLQKGETEVGLFKRIAMNRLMQSRSGKLR